MAQMTYGHSSQVNYLSWDSKPEPQKIPSLQIQPGQQRVLVDPLAVALECVVFVQQRA